MQDVRPRERKTTIRDVNITRPKGRARSTVSEIQDKPQDRHPIPPPPTDLVEKRAPGAPGWFFKGVVGAVIVLILVIIGGLFTFFGNGARVTITLKERTVSINDIFVFGKESGNIPYEIMTLSKEGSKSVPTTGEKQVERKASGSIVIYNDYSSASQRLVKNTRFETPEGLIFRIDNSVVVPGKKTVNGEEVPGSIEALVYADEVGEKYNIGLTDFIVPGFKGDPRFDKFYARSKTSMTGGFKGTVKTASESDIASAREALTKELTESLKNESLSQIPEGFITFQPLRFYQSENLSDAESSEVKIRITERAVLVNAELLGSLMAQKTVAEFDPRRESVLVADPNALSISLQSPDIRPWEVENFSANISGNVVLASQYNEEKLAGDLAGIPKARMTEILTAYPGIERAEATIRPFFKSNFPEDPEKIRVSEAD